MARRGGGVRARWWRSVGAYHGVKAGKLAYRNMTSRWGSCQPATGRICINVRLALYPPGCLEYVVVHELCHLLERGHGSRFKASWTPSCPTGEIGARSCARARRAVGAWRAPSAERHPARSVRGAHYAPARNAGRSRYARVHRMKAAGRALRSSEGPFCGWPAERARLPRKNGTVMRRPPPSGC